MLNTIKIALSGMMAATKKTETVASNIANLNTTGSLDEDGKQPFTPLTTVQESATDSDGNGLGVKADIVAKSPAFTPSFQPDSPFADSDGLVGVPNINLAEEAVNLMLAETSFKANASVIRTADEMSEELLKTFDEEV